MYSGVCVVELPVTATVIAGVTVVVVVSGTVVVVGASVVFVIGAVVVCAAVVVGPSVVVVAVKPTVVVASGTSVVVAVVVVVGSVVVACTDDDNCSVTSFPVSYVREKSQTKVRMYHFLMFSQSSVDLRDGREMHYLSLHGKFSSSEFVAHF